VALTARRLREARSGRPQEALVRNLFAPIELGDPPTPRQAQILRFLVGYVRENGFPPTIREIGAAFDIASTNGVVDHLRALEKRGLARNRAGAARSWIPTARGRRPSRWKGRR
jgi:SOS-response transcriptional repressor LexA